MPCYHPLYGLRQKDGTLQLSTIAMTGILRAGYIVVSCGQCFGCKLEKSRQWAVRILHETKQHQANSFLTLTYTDEELPLNGSLNKSDMRNFIKRTRNHLAAKHKKEKKRGPAPIVRYFQCGEYGDRYGRPHHHVCLFGLDFRDDRIHFKGEAERSLYTSRLLDKLWTHGQCTIGQLTFESAAYTARYVMKKRTGEQAESHYEHVDMSTGEISQLQPEYVTMSLKPGIGASWLDKWQSDVYPSDEVLINGHTAQPPKYYDTLYEREHPEFMQHIKEARIQKNKRHEANNTPERLQVREQVAKAKLALFNQRKLS